MCIFKSKICLCGNILPQACDMLIRLICGETDKNCLKAQNVLMIIWLIESLHAHSYEGTLCGSVMKCFTMLIWIRMDETNSSWTGQCHLVQSAGFSIMSLRKHAPNGNKTPFPRQRKHFCHFYSSFYWHSLEIEWSIKNCLQLKMESNLTWPI